MATSEPGFIRDEGTGEVNPWHGNGETTSDYIPVFEGEQLTIQVWATDTANKDSSHVMIDYAWYENNTAESYRKKPDL